MPLHEIEDDERKELEELEESEDYTDDDLYNIKSWGADLSFRELITMYEEDELLKPELQRHYVWDKITASRFIDSLLLGLPVPSIFLSITEDENRLIIDGYQRIMTVYDFTKGTWSGDGKPFRLSKSNRINERWRGKTFSELSNKEKKKIKSTTIHAIVFEQTHPKEDDTSLYQIFERINTGGRPLTPQEIRNCIYQGPINTLLTELNQDAHWRSLYGNDTPDSRMKDMELILRFLAIHPREVWLCQDGTRLLMKKHLNQFMGSKSARLEDNISKFRKTFKTTTDFIHQNLGKHAFSKSTSSPRLHPAVYDAIMISSHIAIQKGVPSESINPRWKEDLLSDDDFIQKTQSRTTDFESISGRIRSALHHIYRETLDDNG